MPMQRELYPDDWDEIAFRIKEAAGWRCELCGKQCRLPGQTFDTHRRTLTVAHIDHTPANCDSDNLVALCPRCHLRYDGMMRSLRRAVASRAKEQARQPLFT